MAEEAAPAEPTDDPLDLGDTSLQLPPRDEATGRFVKVEPEATPAAPAEPAKPKHPAYLVERARDHGITDEEMAELSSPALDRYLWRLTQQQLQFRTEIARQRDTTNPSSVAAAPPGSGSPAPAPAVAPDEDVDLGINEADFDPEFVKAFKAVSKSHLKKIKALETQLKERDQRDQQREARSAAELLDAAFDRLGKDYEKWFGKGGAEELLAKDPADVSVRRRLAVLNSAGILSKPINRFTITKQLKEAADSFFGVAAADLGAYAAPVPAAETGAPPRITTEQWNDAATARPNGRQNAPEPKGVKRAVQNLAKKLGAEGVQQAQEAGDTEILDTLPG